MGRVCETLNSEDLTINHKVKYRYKESEIKRVVGSNSQT